jgi:glycosyltransferase involved in cell wall biosynthesis
MKILFFVTYPILDASSRYRVYQYIPELNAIGFSCKVNSLFSEYFFKIKNKSGVLNNLTKIIILLFSLIKRLSSLLIIYKYDIIYIHREIFPFFTPLVEHIARKLSKTMIFDFDDAIFLKPKRWSNWRDFLRKPSKVGKICNISDYVIVGNEYLAEYARKYNRTVIILPTVYKSINESTNFVDKGEKKLVIGWIGSWTTLINLEIIKNSIAKLAKEFDFNFHIIGSSNIYNYKIDEFERIVYIPWKLESEEEEISKFDIGIMPLFDDEWEKGKCGFKLIQYMSLGIPVLASPVGINKDLVKNGINGYLASSDEEWYNYLKILFTDKILRKQLGNEAKQFIEVNYSYGKNINLLKKIFLS